MLKKSFKFFNLAIFLGFKGPTVKHCVKNVRVWSYCGPYFPAFVLNTERYRVSLRIQPECWKVRARTTPNTGTFYAVKVKIKRGNK